MKKILFSFLLLFALSNYFSQITKFGQMNVTPLRVNLVKFTQNGYKYWVFDAPGFKINIYNTNLSLFKVISIPISVNTPTNDYNVLYLSDKLFDTDNLIEYFVQKGMQSAPKVYVFNETGSTLMYSDSTFIVATSWNDVFMNTFPIFYDGSKTVLKLGKGIWVSATTNSTVFYALPGTIPCIECSSTGTTVGKPTYEGDANNTPTFYPNPVTDQLKLKYSLPKDYKTAEIKIQDLQGKQIDSFKVTNDFEFIYLPSNYNNGLYLYSLIVDGQLIKTEKVILDK